MFGHIKCSYHKVCCFYTEYYGLVTFLLNCVCDDPTILDGHNGTPLLKVLPKLKR